jgi:hypothetical protein
MFRKRELMLGGAAALAVLSSSALAQQQREYRFYRDEVRYEREYKPTLDRQETRIERRYDPVDGQYETRVERRYDDPVDRKYETRIERRYEPIEQETRIERRYEPVERRYVTRVERRQAPRLYGHPVGVVRESSARGSVRSLSPEAFPRADGWDLRVRYRVRIRDAAPPQRFDLLLHPMDRDRLMLDTQGRPFSVAIPLDRPTDIGRNRADFEHRATMFIPHEVMWSRSIEVRAEIVDRDTGAVLDSSSRSVKFRD